MTLIAARLKKIRMCWGYMQNGAVEVTPYSVNRNSPRRRV